MAEPAALEGKPQPRPRRGTSARRINALAEINNAQSYLEIGVATGNTFLNVTVARKHAVDPRFRLDTAAAESQHVNFFEMPSNEFFLHHVEPETRYDIIFLDGLHTFEQTLRDFCATMRHCHDNTIWVIDDVFPSDMFSALRNESDTRKYRQLHGQDGVEWHGDVFKVMFAIHDFFVNFTYKTINTDGNPQSVLVRRSRDSFKPFCDDLERISRMDYCDFYENQHILNVDSEAGVLEWVRNVMHGQTEKPSVVL
jgi:hypothetical protein